MRVALLTREWPPEVYGGAGVHVEHLVAELRRRIAVDVHCFGADRPDAHAHREGDGLRGANPVLPVIATDLSMVAAIGTSPEPVDLVHSHTWYANLAGHLARDLTGAPHVMTAHSLEPLRPWKAEQLGGGYAVSCWVERTAIEAADAVIAVSDCMRSDVLTTYPGVDPARVHVVRNGVDTSVYRPIPNPAALPAYGIDPTRPYVLFVGRITRQKGVPDLLAAAHTFDPAAQLVVCASAADTPELREEVATEIASLHAERHGVVWVEESVPRDDLVALLTGATVFVCPSVYEPLGIVNLEAMACGTAVVATKVGGIPEVVDDGVTGTLVPPSDPAALASAVNALIGSPEHARHLGAAGRDRVEAEFTWDRIADETLAVYAGVLGA